MKLPKRANFWMPGRWLNDLFQCVKSGLIMPLFPLSMNLVAADVSPLHLKKKVRANSRRPLPLRGSTSKFFGVFSTSPSLPGFIITQNSNAIVANESQRDSGPKPKVARNELPWVNTVRNFPNPIGVVAATITEAQPRWGWGIQFCPPRVARSSQPWAGGHNPFGIAEDITQDVGNDKSPGRGRNCVALSNHSMFCDSIRMAVSLLLFRLA